MQTTWTLDEELPQLPARVRVLGAPRVVESPYGRALHFDGARDGLIIHTNPLRGVRAFTVEALFAPDANGPAEQRFVHVNDDTADARALLETRVVGENFYADTFIKCAPVELPLNDPKLLHACERWHTLALVYDGKIMRQYMNGVLELEGEIERNVFGEGRVSIGCRINEVFWYKGAIRTVRFTDRALEAGELLRP